MSNAGTVPEIWKKLFKLADEVKKLSPWKWMHENDQFIVMNPETKEKNLVSILGSGGEHFAVTVYVGEKGFEEFWDFATTDPEDFDPVKIFDIPQLQLSFENREFLADEDRTLIKKLGLKYRGKNSWPMFRNIEPGYFPWLLTDEEAVLMAHILEQLLEVAPRVKENYEILIPDDEEKYLVRSAVKKDGTITWNEEVMHIPYPEPSDPDMYIRTELMNKLKKLKKGNQAIILVLMKAPIPTVEEESERPFYPYILFFINNSTGIISSMETLVPIPDKDEMIASLPDDIALKFLQFGELPEKLMATDVNTFLAAAFFEEHLGIQLAEPDEEILSEFINSLNMMNFDNLN